MRERGRNRDLGRVNNEREELESWCVSRGEGEERVRGISRDVWNQELDKLIVYVLTRIIYVPALLIYTRTLIRTYSGTSSVGFVCKIGVFIPTRLGAISNVIDLTLMRGRGKGTMEDKRMMGQGE